LLIVELYYNIHCLSFLVVVMRKRHLPAAKKRLSLLVTIHRRLLHLIMMWTWTYWIGKYFSTFY